jgi:ferredoxin-NADP reductase
VIARRASVPGVLTFVLARPGTTEAPAPYLPGQFITLALPTPRGLLSRSYSLCGDGRTDRPWEITVKREGAGSTYLHDTVREGMVLTASLPCGFFTLPARVDASTRLIFVAVGSGITPIMGMLRALARLHPTQRPQVLLHYATRQPDQTIFLHEIEALDPAGSWLKRSYYFSAQGIRLTPQAVVAGANGQPARAHWYVCGPESLKHDLLWTLAHAGVSAEQLHSEVFTSPVSAARATGPAIRRVEGAATTRVQIAETGATLHLRADETLLEGLERSGYQPDYSCRAGACGTCKLRVLAGQVSPTGDALTPAERRAGYVLSCVAHPVGEVTLASGGQRVAHSAMQRVAAGGGRAHRQAMIRRLRVFTAVGVLGLMLGVWTMTTQSSAQSSSAASSSNTTTSSSDSSSGNSGTTGSTQSTSQNAPAPSTQSGGS